MPQSASRNSAEKQPTLNWRITLTSANGNTLATDYSQGIGHVPGYCHACTTYEHRLLQAYQNNAAITGTYPAVAAGRLGQTKTWKPARPLRYSSGSNGRFIEMRPLPTPPVADVIHTLILDSSVNESTSFEDWASEFGYDTDSRDAERIYNACRLIARDYCRLFTAAQRAHLADLLQDY